MSPSFPVYRKIGPFDVQYVSLYKYRSLKVAFVVKLKINDVGNQVGNDMTKANKQTVIFIMQKCRVKTQRANA